MPKRRVYTSGRARRADADAAALVVKVIIANRGAGICGKRLLLESGCKTAGGENLYDTNLKPASHQASQKTSSGTKQKLWHIPVSRREPEQERRLLLHS